MDVRAIILVSMAMINMTAMADDLRIGVGMNSGVVSKLPDGTWKQEGLNNHIDNTGNSFSLQYVGDTGLRWLKYALGGAYREGPEAYGEFVTDNCYGARQFSGGQMVSVGGSNIPDCDRRYHAKSVSVTAKAITLSVNPTWEINSHASIYGAIGISAFQATTKIEWDMTKGVCALGGCEDSFWEKRSVSPYFEIGGAYRNVFVTVYYATHEKSPETMAAGNYGVLSGYRIIF